MDKNVPHEFNEMKKKLIPNGEMLIGVSFPTTICLPAFVPTKPTKTI